MAFTEKELNIAKQIKEQGGTKDDVIEIIGQLREKQMNQAESKTNTEPEKVETGTDKVGISSNPKTGALSYLENVVSDKVTQFGQDIQKEAKSEITQATGEEIPFTKDYKFVENFVPSAKKAFGGLVETIGSPIEAGENFLSTIKAIVAKGAENSPVFGKFIQSTEGDKLIQEAIQESVSGVKEKIGEKGIIKATNEAIQEDPALALTIMTSLFKKLGRMGKISKSKQNKINDLQKQSEEQIKQYLNPTKESTKQITQRITPEIQERLKKGTLTAVDRETLKAITDNKVEEVGKEIGKYIQEGKVKGEIDFEKMIDVLVKEDSKLRLDGTVIPGNEASVRFINAQLNFLGELEKKYGKNLPADKQLELRQKYDVIFDKTVTRDKITKFQDELQVKLADSLREELAKNNPDLDKLNKEYTFNKGLQTVLEQTLQRKTGQDSVGLITEIRRQSQGTAGAVVGGTAGATIGGPVGAAIGAMLGGAVGAKITRVISSPKYKLVSAKKKSQLADAIASGNSGKVEKILDGIIISQGLSSGEEQE